MKITKYDIPDGKEFRDLFPGPGRPRNSSGKQRRIRAMVDLPDFKIGDKVIVLDRDSDTDAPNIHGNRTAKILGLHPEMKAADIAFIKEQGIATIWLTSLRKL